MLIEFNTLPELLNDLELDGDFTSPIRVAMVKDLYDTGFSAYRVFDIQVRVINQSGHILGWTYRTGSYETLPYVVEETDESYRDELSRRVKRVEEWLQLNVEESRVRPGTIWTEGNITLGKWMEEEDG